MKMATRVVLALTLAQRAVAQNLPLPPLPYDYNALEPHIDEATMRAHHLCEPAHSPPSTQPQAHNFCSSVHSSL